MLSVRAPRPVLVLLLASLPAWATADPLPGPVVEEVRSTEAEWGVGDIKGVKATFSVAAPRARIIEALWNIEKFPEMFPDVEKMTIHKKEAARIVVEFEVDAVVQKARYTLDRRLSKDKDEIRWREFGDDGDVRHLRGRWKVTERSPQLSTVLYESYVDVGRFVPTSLVRALALRKLDELVGRVRTAVKRSP